MCGIAGYYGFKGENLLKQFSSELAHRGPDGEGSYVKDSVGLLNRRLAIIDVKGGDQPIYNEDKSMVVVYNGEIYNFEKTHDELVKLGHTFKTKSDTEVVVHAYEEWGEKSFDRHNGMFAFALYDIKKDKLYLVRDHFGIKPLYYSILPDDGSGHSRIIFSSEIKPLINSGLIQKKPNDRIIYRYLKFRIHDDQAETFFEGVYKLLPGEMMVLHENRHSIKTYTHLKEDLLHLADKKQKGLSKEQKNLFAGKLEEAIRMRLISEVPVGTCLSGGLDSSTVVATTNKLLLEKVKEAESVGKIQNSFSAIFPGSVNDEERYIDSLTMTIRDIKGYKVEPKAEHFFDEIMDFVATQEEPTISTGPYAQYKVMQEAHKHVTVVLDGQGSDEMMAGYMPYYFVYLRQLRRKKDYPRLIKELVMSTDVILKYSLLNLVRRLPLRTETSPEQVLRPSFVSKFRKEKFHVTQDNLKARLVEDIFSNSLPSLLRYEDKNAMRFSVEGRVPFLDFELLKYLFSLPDKAIIRNGWNKYILREAVNDLLPEDIVKRRNKIGFTTPEHEWFMRMKNRIYSIFLSDSFAKRKYINQQETLRAFQRFIEGKTDDTLLLWRLLNLELWMRVFIDKKVQKEEKPVFKKDNFTPNEGKNIQIKVSGKNYYRFTIKTELFKKGDVPASLIRKYCEQFFNQLKKDTTYKHLLNHKWFVVISEKAIAISQGRSYFLWEIKPGIFAYMLSTFVKKTPYGIGLGSPWTMQLAIKEVGLPRILLAALLSALTKPFGMTGLFYRVAGRKAAEIDGPTEYSLYPSNVSAKLGPKDPEVVAKEIDNKIRSSNAHMSNYAGSVIIDANDLGQACLANTTDYKNIYVETAFRDNPMGQSSEQTPLTIVIEK